MNKAELRKIYLGKQAALGQAERAKANRQIAERFFSGFDLSGVECIHCFISIDKFNEVETDGILRRIWSELPNVVTAVPRVKFETSTMESVVIGPDSGLVANAWNIREPLAGRMIDEAAVDLAIIPGTAFDKDLHRVGYGKGFYDRFLSRCRTDCIKIGLSYFPPVDAIDDIAAHDVRLDHLITPGALITAGS